MSVHGCSLCWKCRWVFKRSGLGELGNYGADSEVEQYLGNREGTGDYEGMQGHADVEAFKVFAKDNFSRDKKGVGTANL